MSSGDFYGVRTPCSSATAGIAYTCWGQSRIADGKRRPRARADGAERHQLAVSRNAHGFGERLYYTVNDTTLKSLAL